MATLQGSKLHGNMHRDRRQDCGAMGLRVAALLRRVSGHAVAAVQSQSQNQSQYQSQSQSQYQSHMVLRLLLISEEVGILRTISEASGILKYFFIYFYLLFGAYPPRVRALTFAWPLNASISMPSLPCLAAQCSAEYLPIIYNED